MSLNPVIEIGRIVQIIEVGRQLSLEVLDESLIVRTAAVERIFAAQPLAGRRTVLQDIAVFTENICITFVQNQRLTGITGKSAETPLYLTVADAVLILMRNNIKVSHQAQAVGVGTKANQISERAGKCIDLCRGLVSLIRRNVDVRSAVINAVPGEIALVEVINLTDTEQCTGCFRVSIVNVVGSGITRNHVCNYLPAEFVSIKDPRERTHIRFVAVGFSAVVACAPELPHTAVHSTERAGDDIQSAAIIMELEEMLALRILYPKRNRKIASARNIVILCNAKGLLIRVVIVVHGLDDLTGLCVNIERIHLTVRDQPCELIAVPRFRDCQICDAVRLSAELLLDDRACLERSNNRCGADLKIRCKAAGQINSILGLLVYNERDKTAVQRNIADILLIDIAVIDLAFFLDEETKLCIKISYAELICKAGQNRLCIRFRADFCGRNFAADRANRLAVLLICQV